MCCDSALLLSYSPFFCGVKIVFCPLFITVSRYYDMYAQGGVTYTPCTERLRRSFSSCTSPVLNAHEPLGGSWLNGAGTGRNTVFGRIVHAYSCYQSENNSFLCLLKRVINLIVLNHYICYDNNAFRITCQELFLDFFSYNKYDRLIKERKSRERKRYKKLWSMTQRK